MRHCAACRCRGCASGNLAPAAQSGAATSPPLAGKISGAWPPESCLASERWWSCLRLPCSSCCRSAPATLLRLPRAWGRGGPAGSEDKVLKDECGVPFFFPVGVGGPPRGWFPSQCSTTARSCSYAPPWVLKWVWVWVGFHSTRRPRQRTRCCTKHDRDTMLLPPAVLCGLWAWGRDRTGACCLIGCALGTLARSIEQSESVYVSWLPRVDSVSWTRRTWSVDCLLDTRSRKQHLHRYE